MRLVSGIAAGWLVLAFCLPSALSSHGSDDDSANQDYIVKVWGADDGLTEGSVTDVAQTPEGYLWIGTLFGSVLRFDGTRFVSYSSANTPEFSLKWGVPRFMVDHEGTLWISMFDGGMTTWSEKGFHSVFTSTNPPNRLLWSAPGRVIFASAGGSLLRGQRLGEMWEWQAEPLPEALPQSQSCADAQGRIWYLRDDQKIGIWAGHGTRAVTPVPDLREQRATLLTADSTGQIWLGTDQALMRWLGDHFELMTPTNGEAALKIKRLIPSGREGLWVEANDRMRRCVGRRWVAESQGWINQLGKVNALRFVHGDAEGGLWASVGDLGLIHVREDGTFHRLTTRDGLPSNRVQFAYQDRDGNTWTGYERGGLVRIRRRIFRTVGNGGSLSENLINTVCEDPQGAVWIGTHVGTVARCQDGSCTNLVLPGAARAQDSMSTVDGDGRLWIGSQGAGLLMWETGRVQQVASPAQLPGYARLLLPSREGRLWGATLWSIFSVREGQLAREYLARDASEHPTSLAQAADGTIWAGTLSGLLLHWDDGRFVPLAPPARGSLGRIWALWADPDGSLWAGTAEGGLLHWHQGKFHRFTAKDGLPSDSIAQVLGDAQGNLWLGTRSGVARISQSDLTRFELGQLDELPVSQYGLADGLLTVGSAIMFQPNCWRGRDGTLFFAMANSVAAVRPQEVHINPVPPTVVLEAVTADEKQVWPDHVGVVLTVTPKADKPGAPVPLPMINVGPGRGDLEFQYTGLSIGSPSLVRFKYKLEGSDSAWHDVGGERKAVYRHVPPGEYVFHVIAYNSDSVCSRESALLALNVRPHFYQTAWFQGGCGIAAVAGLSLAAGVAMRQRMKRRLEELRRQHDLERERSRIAQDLHDDLGAGLTEISLLGGLLQSPAGGAERNQLALPRIVNRCHDLVTALDEIVWAINPRNDSANSLSSYLCRYAQEFLEPSSIRCRLEVHDAEPDRPIDSEQRHHLFLAFKEILTNVVRHSGATEVSIRISPSQEQTLSVRVEDNGHGLPKAVGADANGLGNLHRRMAQIGGRCEIAARAGGGVAVHLRLPLS